MGSFIKYVRAKAGELVQEKSILVCMKGSSIRARTP